MVRRARPTYINKNRSLAERAKLRGTYSNGDLAVVEVHDRQVAHPAEGAAVVAGLCAEAGVDCGGAFGVYQVSGERNLPSVFWGLPWWPGAWAGFCWLLIGCFVCRL